MEDVIDVYHRPYDVKHPQVCMDETSLQLIGEVRPPLSARPGTGARYDSEYIRNGVANVFIAFEPLAGVRQVAVTERRTRIDWAHFIAGLLEGPYREAERVVLVMDQLNTHTTASLYEAFPPERAKQLADRLEIHHTPKHGSWLNMAEIEFSALSRDLPERIGERATLETHVAAWERRRNESQVKVDWQFTTAEARVKLRKLYPTIND